MSIPKHGRGEAHYVYSLLSAFFLPFEITLEWLSYRASTCSKELQSSHLLSVPWFISSESCWWTTVCPFLFGLFICYETWTLASQKVNSYQGSCWVEELHYNGGGGGLYSEKVVSIYAFTWLVYFPPKRNFLSFPWKVLDTYSLISL